MILFPDISPNIFTVTIFGIDFSLRWYAVSYIAGFIVAAAIMKFFSRRDQLWRYNTPPLEKDEIESFITYLILGVIFGGRLGYVIFYNLEFYLNDPVSILRLWDGGMSFHGGFIGVVIASIFYCKHHGVPLLNCGDLIALATPPGLMFGRLANFINSELWGRPTDVPWGVVFPGDRAQECEGVIGLCARHPTQLYEAGLEGLLLFAVMVSCAFLGLLKRSGAMIGVFMLGYGLSRFLVEFYRMADPQFISPDNPEGYLYSFGMYGLSMGQFLSIPMVVLGFIFTVRKVRQT